jgi:hypothetical protein
MSIERFAHLCCSVSRMWLLAILFVGALGIFCLLLFDTVSNRTATENTMWMVKRRILLYARQNSRLPETLDALPILPKYDNSIKDAWGNTLQLEIHNGEIVTLRSFGRNNVPGGEGENADIVLSFSARTKNGTWSDPLVEWCPGPASLDNERAGAASPAK